MPADKAFFGRGWGGEEEWVDDALARLLRQVGDVAELHDLGEAAVLAPEAWLDDISLRDLMRSFLERAGVRHGLWPVEAPRTPWKRQGVTLNSPSDIDPAGLPAWVPTEIREEWLHAATSWTRQRASHQYVDYTLLRNQMLPGQLAWATFPPNVRGLYGELVLAGLDRWDDEAFDA